MGGVREKKCDQAIASAHTRLVLAETAGQWQVQETGSSTSPIQGFTVFWFLKYLFRDYYIEDTH